MGDISQPTPPAWTIAPRDRRARPAAPAPLVSPDDAGALFLRETLRLKPPHNQPNVEPGSLGWFELAERLRHERQAAWLPRLLEFTRHDGESVLGLGDGLGSDWLQYAKHGASVTVCCRDAQQLAMVRRNFDLRGLKGTFRHTTPVGLPLPDDSIDVACVLGLPTGRENETVAEVYRVLRPGGKILAVVPARRNAVFWQRVYLPWYWLVKSRRFDEGRRPLTAAEIRRLFPFFIEHRIHKRHLKRGDLPPLLRWLPLPFAERWMGRFLIWKAFKPVLPTAVRALAA